MTNTARLGIPVRLLVALVLVVSVGCSSIPAETAPAELHAANFVPADTWFFAQVTLRPSLSQLANATRLASAFSRQRDWEAYVNDLGSSSTGTAPSDVLSLLDGEVAIAAFGPSSTSTDIPHYVVLAHSPDPDHLLRVLLQPDSEVRGTPVLPRPRKDPHGANIYTSPLSHGLATFRGWLILADSQQDLNDALDRISGTVNSRSLNDEPHFKKLVDRLPVDRLGLEYVDTGALLRSVAWDLPMNEAGVPPESQALLSKVQSQAALSFAAVSNGLEIHLEGTTQVPPDLAGEAAAELADLGDPGDAFGHLPADTLVAFGTGLPMLTPEIDDALNAELQQAADELDVPELAALEVHPSQWLAGPIAVGANAGEAGSTPNVFLVAQVSDPAAAGEDLDKVTGLFPPKSVNTLSIADNTFFQAPLSDTDDQSLTYGLADDWLYAVNGDAESVVNAADTGGLTENPRFANLQSTLGSEPINVFADIQGIRELATSMFEPGERQTYNDEIGPLLNPLTFFGGSLRSDANGDVHGHFVLGVGGM
ncbi:MAG TPA: DUF3352 domain-containing protein [Chloroflexota bacterium]